MERASASDPSYCSPNPSEMVPPAGEGDGTSSSERTVSFEYFQGDHSAGIEVDSGNGRTRDQAAVPVAQKHVKKTTPVLMKTDQGKLVDEHGPQEVIRTQGKGGVLKILPKNNKVVRVTGQGNIIVSKSASMNGETSGSMIVPTNAKVEVRKRSLPLPQWLKDHKSTVADLDGWQIVEVARTDFSEKRKDKFYTHRDYAHTFRSKIHVKHFLETGEAIGKGLLQKKSADDPHGQSSGSRRSTKRRL